ncbi:MAG: Tm-1-like ATP-binding domain-containing protein [Nitrososphaerota archaeon]
MTGRRGNIVLIATLDTKGNEALYIKKKILSKGWDVIVIDAGIFESKCELKPEITKEEVAGSVGETIESLRSRGRGYAVDAMAEGTARLLSDLCKNGLVSGVISIGGGGGTKIGTRAMKELPFGIPKFMVSTIASGKHRFGDYVGTKDIVMMHSVVDVVGENSLVKKVFDNAVGAICGMAEEYEKVKFIPKEQGKKRVAISMYGNTTPCVMIIKDFFERKNCEVICFHSNGVGGRCMEDLILDGEIDIVVDVTTHEILDEIAGGIHTAGKDRLTAASKKSIPQLVVPGSLDFITCGPLDTLNEKLRSRRYVRHNELITLVEPTLDEVEKATKLLVERVNESRGPVMVGLPLEGLSMVGSPGGGLYNKEIVETIISLIEKGIREDIPVVKVDATINDSKFAEKIAEEFWKLLKKENVVTE